jgi:hypothetical protein
LADYIYKNLPLTRSIARELVLNYLAENAGPSKRDLITREITKFHQDRGGKVTSDPVAGVKKVLQILVADGKVIRERRLARFEERDWWPCKIGFSQVSLISRILAQINATGMSELPVVGLAIKTEDGRGLERAIHFALDEADTRKEDAPGNEWFHTSPSRIKSWYNTHLHLVGSLRLVATAPSDLQAERFLESS